MAFLGGGMKPTLLMALLVAGFSWPVSADTRYDLRVDGLACPYCAYGIEKKLKALDGVDGDTLAIRLNEGLVSFTVRGDATITEPVLKQLINDAGFTLRGLETQDIVKPEQKND